MKNEEQAIKAAKDYTEKLDLIGIEGQFVELAFLNGIQWLNNQFVPRPLNRIPHQPPPPMTEEQMEQEAREFADRIDRTHSDWMPYYLAYRACLEKYAIAPVKEEVCTQPPYMAEDQMMQEATEYASSVPKPLATINAHLIINGRYEGYLAALKKHAQPPAPVEEGEELKATNQGNEIN